MGTIVLMIVPYFIGVFIMLKVGVVGVGGISGAHIPAWEEIREVELVALCDIRQERLDKYPSKRHYNDFKEMLEEEDVERVYSTAKKNKVKFMIAQVLRFWPEYELLKEIFDTEKYGKLLSGTMTRLGCYPKWSWDGWMMDEKRSGLTPFDLHIHDLDFMVYAFGAPKKVAHQYRSKRPDQDFISVTYDFGDFSINSEASWYATSYPFTAEFRFQFEDALVSNENGKMQIFLRDGKIDLSEDAEGDTGDINLPKSDAYANEIKYFLDCVINDKDVEKVKDHELLTVLKILNSL